MQFVILKLIPLPDVEMYPRSEHVIKMKRIKWWSIWKYYIFFT